MSESDKGEKVSKKGFFFRRKATRPVVEEKAVDSTESTEEVKPAKQEVPTISFTQLFRYSTKFELFLDAIGLVAAVGAGGAQPLMSILFGNLVEDFVTFTTVLLRAEQGDEAAKQQLPTVAANFRRVAALDATYFVYLAIGLFACTFTYLYIWVYTGEVNSKRIREYYLKAVLRQDVAYFDDVGAGEVATRIQTDTHLVQQGISEKVALAVTFVGAFITGYVIAYARSWRLALALTSVLPALGLTGGVMNKFVSSYVQLSLKHVAEGGTLAEEVISTIRTAQAFGTQGKLSETYDSHVNGALSSDLKTSYWTGGGVAVMFFIIYSSYSLTFSFGTTLINSGHGTPGEVINVFLAILMGSFSMALLAPEMQAINNGRGAAAKLYQTIDRVPEIDSADPNGQKPENVKGEIAFQDVEFSYPSRPTIQVTKGLSLKFEAGKTVALVGASGSGKSTIVSLIERFYDPTAGVIKLDGINIKDLNLKWLRSQIGLVSQEPTLFATSIKANVAHGLISTKFEHVSDEEKFALIKEACIKANADGFISELPSGYDTLVGERGFLLSGGQKQRVAIARAIVSDPKILLLDEATSALDTQSEGVVQDALDKAAAGRTTIAIAHRLSTVKDADVICVLSEGLVVEQGSHDELLQANGAYAGLVQAQKLKAQDDTEIEDVAQTAAPEEQVANKEISISRVDTGHSLASEIIKQKSSSSADSKLKDLSIFMLFVRMGRLSRKQWKNYVIGTIFSIMAGAVYPSFGIVYADGIVGFSATDNHARRVAGDRNALWFFIIALLSTLVLFIQNSLFASAAAKLTAKLRSLSFKAILRQDIEFFDKPDNTTGSLTAGLSDNPQKVKGLAGVTLATIIQSIATLIVGSIIGLVYFWQVGLIAIACTPLLVSTGYIRLRVVVMKDQTNKKAHEASAHLACEAAGAIRTVASLTREDDCLEAYSKSLEVPLRKSNRTSFWSNLLFSGAQSMGFLVIALVFWFGSGRVSRQEASTKAFFVGLMSTVLGAIQAGNVFTFVPDVSAAKGAGSAIIRLLDAVPDIDAESRSGKSVNPEGVEGHLRLERIHFRYPTRPAVRVLRDLSLEVEPGTYIALVGASGSGKSTIIQLIERFYDPLAGDIYLDGEPITELNVQEYRKNIALVSQEPTLYAGTIRFNVLLGAIKPHEEVTQEELEKACRDANILEFIQSLPKGFETEVGGKGSQLSGGQKQRIAIARALLRNPKVLLLDEATSALDSASEKVVQAALDQAAQGRTTIAIAHRLSTIQNADKIYFIKEGRVSEAGTHDQLLTKRGHYYEYVQLQGLK